MNEYSVKDVCAAIEREIRKQDGIYFSSAWREKLGEILKEESRYAKLVQWLNERLELYEGTINIFSPGEWSEEFEESYLRQIEDCGVLIHARDLLLDSRCSGKMRENIEKFICRRYGIHYSEGFGEYIGGVKR